MPPRPPRRGRCTAGVNPTYTRRLARDLRPLFPGICSDEGWNKYSVISNQPNRPLTPPTTFVGSLTSRARKQPEEGQAKARTDLADKAFWKESSLAGAATSL